MNSKRTISIIVSVFIIAAVLVGALLYFFIFADGESSKANIEPPTSADDISVLVEIPAAITESENLGFDATESKTESADADAEIMLPSIPSAYCVPVDTQREQVEVIAVIAPDLISVALNDEIVNVRYIGIDTGELDDSIGAQTLMANSSLQGQMVTLVAGNAASDEEGVLPRYVFSGDYFVNFQLLEWGFANVTEEGLDEDCAGFFLAAQSTAQSQQVGLWAPKDLRIEAELWREWPVVPYISENARDIYLQGVADGHDVKSFTIFGDCQSLGWLLFQPFVWQSYDPGEEYLYLEDARLNYYDSLERIPVTSFDGATVASMLSVYWANQTLCETGETPVECEFRISNPSTVLIMLGTNWTGSADEFETYMRQLVEFSIDSGVLPIIVTKPDGGPDHPLNARMAVVAYDYDVPLWNFWLAVQDLPNQGMDADDPKGIHFSDESFIVKRYTGMGALNEVLQIWINRQD